MKLDTFDRAILDLIQKDAELTATQLATHIALSPSAIQRRLHRLKDAGVIARYAAILDPRKTGRHDFYLVSLEVERERPELLTRLKSWLAAEPLVQEAFYVTGQADFMLVVTAPDTEIYDNLMSRLVSANGNIRRFTTSVALGVVKRGLSIPMSGAEED